MKKVVIFYPHIGEYGGIERNIIALVETIVHNGLDAAVLCYYDNIDLQKYTSVKFSISSLGDSSNAFVKGRKLRKWFKANQKQIVDIPFYFGAKAGFYGALAFKNDYALHYTDPPSLLSKSSVVKKQNFLGILKANMSKFIMSKGVANAKICLTMTKWNADELNDIYNREFKVFYQGGVPASTESYPQKKCRNKILRLFSICRLSTTKNLSWILDSVNYLIKTEFYYKTYSSLEVTIAGKGPELENLEQKAKDLEIEKYVSFPGFLTSEELEEKYLSSDIFLVPGRQGFGLPILEALYRKLPVVMNKESRISEILNANPWVSISENNSISFSKELFKHINELRNNYPDSLYLKDLPTEVKWANDIGSYCGWWKNNNQ